MAYGAEPLEQQQFGTFGTEGFARCIFNVDLRTVRKRKHDSQRENIVYIFPRYQLARCPFGHRNDPVTK